jgi:hypothetical protein
MDFTKKTTRIQAALSALNAGQLDAVGEFILPEFYSYAPIPGDSDAVSVFSDLLNDLREGMPDLHVIGEAFESDGEQVRFSLTISGTLTGSLWGKTATQKQSTWTSQVQCRFDGQRFAVAWLGLSTPELMGQLRAVELIPPADKMNRAPQDPVSLPESLIRPMFNGQVADKACSHLDQIQVTKTDIDVCPQCVESGDIWPALRMCLTCGYVGCCDTSDKKHMKTHYEESGHSLFRSIRLDESWAWCYEDNVFIRSGLWQGRQA